jgi:prepilin-type N-terminal cleavage/methylation domain-containing protein
MRHRNHTTHPGFTLVELLVVIGLITLLIGLALPAVLHSLKAARRTRTVSDFQLIGTALEAYKSNFGDYPRFDSDASTYSLNVMQDRGARLLCRALLAPGPAVVSGTGTTDFNGANNGGTGQAPDGADGPGFRLRSNGTTAAGTVWRPYIDASKFRLGNPGAIITSTKTWDSVNFTDATLLDPEGNPILYYPATPGTQAVTVTGAFVTTYNPQTPATANAATGTSMPYPLYNVYDNAGYGSTTTYTPTNVPPVPGAFMPATELQVLLGEQSTTSQTNGSINPSASPPESATTTIPYLLWSAGEDGIFGRTPALTNRTDDVTNFDLPANLVKQ